MKIQSDLSYQHNQQVKTNGEYGQVTTIHLSHDVWWSIQTNS